MNLSNTNLPAATPVEPPNQTQESDEHHHQVEKLETVGRLASGVAHDINNLLTVINGYSRLVLRKLSPSDPMHHSISEIALAGERAGALTAQLLRLTRKEAVEPRIVNLNDIVGEVEKMLGRLMGENIWLRSFRSVDLGCVRADPGQLHQVLTNLAINARDAMPMGGVLLIETENVHRDNLGPMVQLRVIDTGIGMTKEVMARLFEPFFTTKRAGEGTGLGLATVHRIVKESGGTIAVTSEPDRGTTFLIEFPRVDKAAGLTEQPEALEPSLHGSETILVVEDQDQVRRMAVDVLRDYGYQVKGVAGPKAALRYIEEHESEIHLLLTDLVMPDMSGWDLAEEFRAIRPTTAVIFMSGYGEPTLRGRRVAPGSYLAKPFSPEELAGKVKEVLQRALLDACRRPE
jgi:two-component system cell cycle sensor histidine kinase/response regulator CckA